MQEWCAEEGVPRDSALSVRLVLEELLTNICMYAQLPPGNDKIELDVRMEGPQPDTQPASPQGIAGNATMQAGQGMVHITLCNAGPPFNPLEHPHKQQSTLESPPGGQGLTLVRLIATGIDYQRTREGDKLRLSVPLTYGNAQPAGSARHQAKKIPLNPLEKLRALWCGSVALRQTVFFTICAMLLIWGAMFLYTQEVVKQRHESARLLARQAMRTQAGISAGFLQRVGQLLENVGNVATALPQGEALLTNPDELIQQLQAHTELRMLLGEVAVRGIVVGYNEKAWLYTRDSEDKEDLRREQLPQSLLPLVAQEGKPARWESLFISFSPDDPHASMLYAKTLVSSGKAQDGWIGVILSMPWIADTLNAISGFKQTVPFYTDSQGRYVIFPKGHALGYGAQSLTEETLGHPLPGLADIEAKMLSGNTDAVQLRPIMGGDATPWELPWQGPTTLAYYPMTQEGWYLGMLISSEELGDAPAPLPVVLFLLALLGPLCVGLVTWVVTSHTLRPLNTLVSSLEKFSTGDMDTPFPQPTFPDEIGDMFTTFERVRVTMRASMRNLMDSAAAQQRMQNELSLARSIQESMLPAVFPSLSWVQVDACIDMSREVCGDLYDCFSLHAQAERVCVVIGDVCGKGVPAAIIMSRIMSLAHSFLQGGHTPAQTLEQLNTALLRSDASSMFVTMLVGILEADGRFHWASAGHPPPMPGPLPKGKAHGNTEGDSFTPAPSTPLEWPGELVLGVRTDQQYSTFTTRLLPGQSLLLYTDGADEAMGWPAQPAHAEQEPEIYGETRLAASFDKACRAYSTPEKIVEEVREDIIRFMGGQTPADDISLMVLTYQGT